jgi:ABC-2 type transport system permease protein
VAPPVVLVIAATELRRRLRDRSAWVVGLVAPLALAAVITMALSGAGGGRLETTIVIADDGASTAAAAFLDGLDGRDERGVSFRRVASGAEVRAAVDAGDAGAGIVVPVGFDDALAGPEPAGVVVVRDPRRSFSGEVARSVAEDFAARVEAGRLAVGAALAPGADPVAPEVVAALAARAAEAGVPIEVELERPDGRTLDVAAYFGPSMAFIFLFFIIGFGPRSLLREQAEGTLDRLRASPIHPAAVLVGKTLAVFVLGLASLLAMWGATTLLFGASWGDPVAVVVLSIACVVSVAGIAAVLTTVARSEEQVQNLTTMVAFSLALLGGNFVPPGDIPDTLRSLSLATPNGWALRSFADLGTGVGGVGTILPALGVLLAIGLAGMAVAAARSGNLAVRS